MSHAAGQTIAVVDDEEPVRVALRRLCRSSGLSVEVYPSGEAFLAALPGKTPDCLILDLHMPTMNGLEVQVRARKVAPALPIIVLTGYDTPETRAQAITAGAVAYFCKPVDAESLLAAVSSATDKAAD